MYLNNHFRVATLLLATVALAGCAVHPRPLSLNAYQAYAADKLARLATDQEPITGPIGLDEAIARGLKYNLDFRVETFQTALKMKDLQVTDCRLLPASRFQTDETARFLELERHPVDRMLL